MTLDDFPLWSVWMRDYAHTTVEPEHWVLFVVEAHSLDQDGDLQEVTGRVLASQAPPDRGTTAAGSSFRFAPSRGTFPLLVKQVA